MLRRLINTLAMHTPHRSDDTQVAHGARVRNPVVSLRPLQARYDAAATTDGNRRHWANADGLSADAAANPEVRRVLRNRARYEVANNSYARGIVLTLANDVIGTGPRLQMLTGDPDADRRIEMAFADWARTIGLAAKLRTMRMARAESGEGFMLLARNPSHASPVQLDVRLIEAVRSRRRISERASHARSTALSLTTSATRSSITSSSSIPAICGGSQTSSTTASPRRS